MATTTQPGGDDREFTISKRRHKWRFVCPDSADTPEPHHDWYIWDGVFSCRTCKNARHTDPEQESLYDHLIDKKTGATVHRDQLVIDI